MQILGLFSGKKTSIGPRLSPTGIYKHAVTQAQIDQLGIIGDIQADKRFHGGPHKALHQFSLLAYEKIIKRYPLLHRQVQAGSIGENISAGQMHEHNVCIGDIYTVGSAILQVSGPRVPCWKIDEKFHQSGLHLFIREHRLSGWYFRVLQNGIISVGDNLVLQNRPHPQLTIRQFLDLVYTDIKSSQLAGIIQRIPELDPDWLQKTA